MLIVVWSQQKKTFKLDLMGAQIACLTQGSSHSFLQQFCFGVF
jgi:hypothetical protein